MEFKLIEKAKNHLKTTFHVVNSSGDICGSINVHNGQEVNDLLRCWSGPANSNSSPQSRPQQQSQVGVMAAAFLQARTKFSPQHILRGCNG